MFELLRDEHPEIFRSFSREGEVSFDDGVSRYRGIIYETLTLSRVRIRFRADGNGFFTRSVQPHVSGFLSLARDHEVTIQLRKGELVVLDNSRMLHGRTAFRGTRSILRILARSGPWLEPGFDADHRRVASLAQERLDS